jgi:hypothetical protein
MQVESETEIVSACFKTGQMTSRGGQRSPDDVRKFVSS